jgi:hypothetical protein
MTNQLLAAFTLATALSAPALPVSGGAAAQMEPNMIVFSSTGRSVPCETVGTMVIFNISTEREITFSDKYPDITGNPALTGAGQGNRAAIRFRTPTSCVDLFRTLSADGSISQVVFDTTQSTRRGRRIVVYPAGQGPAISIGAPDQNGRSVITLGNINRDYGLTDIGRGGGFALR